MAYITALLLADGPEGLKELAELFDVDADLMAATLAGDARDDWPPAEIAAADAALASIERYIDQAAGEINARLAVRGYPLPQSAAQFPVLVVWARAITRYHLHRQRDRTSEDTGRHERDYRDALRALEAVAAGTLSLGAGDPMAAQPAGVGRITSQPRVFSRDSLRGL